MPRSDVVLVHVPFVGTPGGKLRPALIVQNDHLNRVLNETVVAEITSNTRNAARPHQVLIDISTPDGAASGLLVNSAVRRERLQTIPQADVQRTIGQFSAQLMAQVEDAIKAALEL